MTEAEQLRILEAITGVQQAVVQLPDVLTAGTEDLYRAYQNLHTVALAPWCILCDILSANITPRSERSEADAINLEELFGDEVVK